MRFAHRMGRKWSEPLEFVGFRRNYHANFGSSSGKSGFKPGEVADDEVDAHLGNPDLLLWNLEYDIWNLQSAISLPLPGLPVAVRRASRGPGRVGQPTIAGPSDPLD